MTEQIILQLISGLAAGIVCKPFCSFLAKRLLEARDKGYTEKTSEGIILIACSGIIGALIGLLASSPAETAYLFMLLIIGMTIAMTDIHCRIIPNELNLAVFLTAAGFGIPSLLGVEGFPEFNIVSSLAGFATCFLIFSLPAALSKNVGAGDVKLAAAMGFCLGLEYSLFGVVLMGGLVFLYTMMQRRMPAISFLKSRIPMGPFLSCSMVLVLLIVKADSLGIIFN